MQKSRCLGLVGGLGVGATTTYYKRLVLALEERGRVADLVIVHADVAVVLALAAAGNRSGVAEYLCRFVERMKAAGAEIAAIPAVTPQMCSADLAKISPLPVIGMFGPVNAAIRARGLQRVGLLGTRVVMDRAVFGLIDAAEVVGPAIVEMEEIDALYLELLRQGEGSVQQRERLEEIARGMIDREGLDAVVLAGTDFGQIFNGNNPRFPLVDCAAVHLRAIADAVLAHAAAR